jgi:hypothetical protein
MRVAFCQRKTLTRFLAISVRGRKKEDSNTKLPFSAIKCALNNTLFRVDDTRGVETADEWNWDTNQCRHLIIPFFRRK